MVDDGAAPAEFACYPHQRFGVETRTENQQVYSRLDRCVNDLYGAAVDIVTVHVIRMGSSARSHLRTDGALDGKYHRAV